MSGASKVDVRCVRRAFYAVAPIRRVERVALEFGLASTLKSRPAADGLAGYGAKSDA